MKRLHVPSQFNSLFISYISTAKPFSLVRVYIEVKIKTKSDPAKFEMSKIYQGNFQSLCRLAQLFLNTSAVILRKKSEIVGENFFLTLKMILLKYQEIDVQIQTFTDEN